MSKSDTPALDAWNAYYSTPAKVFQEAQRLRERAGHDEAQALYNAGRKKAKEIAQNLLNDGDSIDKIVRMTGLTREEVEGLRQ